MLARGNYAPAPTGWKRFNEDTQTSESGRGLEYNSMEATFVLSLVFQVIVLGVSFAAFGQWASTPDALRIVLVMETVVQGVECLWYGFVGFMYVQAKWSINTGIRYLDWMITTPVMLTSILLFGTWEANHCTTGQQLFEGRRGRNVAAIVVLDLLMLYVGAAYQNGWSKSTELMDSFASCGRSASSGIGIFWGWIPFVAAFGILIGASIEDDWYGNEATGGLLTLYLSFVAWGIYGVVAILGTWKWSGLTTPYFSQMTMNTWYNLLDIVSKNIMGIVISALILNNNYVMSCSPPGLPPYPPNGAPMPPPPSPPPPSPPA